MVLLLLNRSRVPSNEAKPVCIVVGTKITKGALQRAFAYQKEAHERSTHQRPQNQTWNSLDSYKKRRSKDVLSNITDGLGAYSSLTSLSFREHFDFKLAKLPLQVAITKLKMDKDRRAMIERKAAGRARVTGLLKGKHTEESIAEE
ncbi:60S ribosomal protein L26 [Toxocara canis]|uniref:60S ribosomal protein L26 n=1 Tax=Toxocara canis TaxID=6265 RepID=A0A0B2VB77_TOXCA|nr:60S ribosomal protein L26 [Toxocara canis]